MDSSSESQLGNCSLLVARTDFATYVQQLQTATDFNQTWLLACQADICNVLWGDGNGDVSGIGAIIGYLLESTLGLVFALSLVYRMADSKRKCTKKSAKSLKKSALARICDKFFSSSIFFSGSIQIACVIFLIRKDFGISANNLGGLTVQITWSVALLCMLPLVYLLNVLNYIDKERSHYRIFLFGGCWFLFFYTFISQMIGTYAPDEIGQGAGPGGTTIITVPEWNALNDLCLAGVNVMSSVETRILSSFGAAGSIFVATYGLLALLWFIATQNLPNHTRDFCKSLHSRFPRERRFAYVVGCLAFIVLVLTIPQFWGLMRLRGIQKAVALSSGTDYADNQWTFGQVTAVMLFVPVFAETGYLMLEESGKNREKRKLSQ